MGNKISIETFEKKNSGLNSKYFHAIKKHLLQDSIFDEFIREKIDVSHKTEEYYMYDGKRYDGPQIRELVKQIEDEGFYLLSFMVYKMYGITTNQEWLDAHVKKSLDRAYPQNLSDGTYSFMQIPEEINRKITNHDWSDLNKGHISSKEYIKMYEKVIGKMISVDFEKDGIPEIQI